MQGPTRARQALCFHQLSQKAPLYPTERHRLSRALRRQGSHVRIVSGAPFACITMAASTVVSAAEISPFYCRSRTRWRALASCGGYMVRKLSSAPAPCIPMASRLMYISHALLQGHRSCEGPKVTSRKCYPDCIPCGQGVTPAFHASEGRDNLLHTCHRSSISRPASLARPRKRPGK